MQCSKRNQRKSVLSSLLLFFFNKIPTSFKGLFSSSFKFNAVLGVKFITLLCHLCFPLLEEFLPLMCSSPDFNTDTPVNYPLKLEGVL